MLPDATTALDVCDRSRLDDVIGMWQVKQRIERSVANPVRGWADGDRSVVPPNGVMVYGAPGCGVSFVAACLATDLAATPTPVNLVEDVDVLADATVAITDRLFAPDGELSIVVATSHRPWALPEWMFSSDRFDRLVFVPPPDWDARRFRLWQVATARRRPEGVVDALLPVTEMWTGADIDGLLEDDSMPWDDLDRVAEIAAARRPSVVDWLAEARVLPVFRDGRGRCDDLVAYLQRYRLY